MAMYNMIGGDGREYGPITAEQLRQWFAEGRVDRRTQIRGDDQAQWLAFSEVAEFADLFSAPASASPPPLGPPPGTIPPAPADAGAAGLPPAAVPSISGLAVASLCLAILSLSCYGLSAIPAVICGHIARRKIAQSNGTLTGAGLALAGLIVG